MEITEGICGEDNRARMAAITILSSVCILTVFGNTMVLLAFFRNKRLRTFGNYFLISLAVSDLVMGCWTFPNTIANLVLCKSWMMALVCEISGYIDNVILTNSLVTLAACSYDRYLVITKPLFYKRYMSGKRTLLILSATWIYSMTLSLPPFVGIGDFRFSNFSLTCALTEPPGSEELQSFKIYFSSYIILTFIPSLSTMIGCYYFIFQTARQVNAKNPNVLKCSGAPKGLKNLKAGLMIVVIIGVYLIFVLPVMIVGGLHVVFNVSSIPKGAALVVVYLVMCNSFCNPIIYGIMNKDFRKTFTNIMYCRSDRSFRQMNYRRESQAYSISSNGTSLKKKDIFNSNNSNLSSDRLKWMRCPGALVQRKHSERFLVTQSLIRRDSELKRYITEKRRLSTGNKEMSTSGNVNKAGTILELSEHSVSERLSVCKTAELGKNCNISEFNPFQYIWTIKSSSYECISKERRRRKNSL